MLILTSKLGSYPPHTKQKLALDLIKYLIGMKVLKVHLITLCARCGKKNIDTRTNLIYILILMSMQHWL